MGTGITKVFNGPQNNMPGASETDREMGSTATCVAGSWR